jgi:ABC-type Zn uptake system ZnuABC Zn-binding protein ZnuA
VITKMKAGNLRLVTVQPYQNRKTAETVATHTGALVLDWPSFPGGPGTESYLEWMDRLVKSTVAGFEQTR